MKERPILFSAPMVRAILEGRKTQTRRAVAPGNSRFGSAPRLYWDHADFSRAWVDGNSRSLQYLHVPCHVESEGICETCDRIGWPGTSHRLYPNFWPRESCRGQEDECPPYRQWVKEAFTFINAQREHNELCIGYDADGDKLPNRPSIYVTDEQFADFMGDERDKLDPFVRRKYPAMFMNRFFSRITLEIAEVRVQRVQEISEADAKAEGAKSADFATGRECFLAPEMGSYRLHFRSIWEEINGTESWTANPCVWALSFKVVA
jgi:hypothetical protein